MLPWLSSVPVPALGLPSRRMSPLLSKLVCAKPRRGRDHALGRPAEGAGCGGSYAAGGRGRAEVPVLDVPVLDVPVLDVPVVEGATGETVWPPPK